MPAAVHESYAKLFLRFLRFGLLAWGGPVAQIAMVRQELVEEEAWVSRERFNRLLSVYQVLPGPEAHELCVYFGFLARGRIGGLLAGLGFMAPGFALMLLLSWLYVRFDITDVVPEGLFYGFGAAVLALVARGVVRIGRHALTAPWLWALGAAGLAAELSGVHFALTLVFTGSAYVLLRRRQFAWVLVLAGAVAAVALVPGVRETDSMATTGPAGAIGDPSLLRLFGSGLLAGLLTFGGAYTAIPLMRRDAVLIGGWMTNGQFVDGLALSGILPAPLIIFGTFVGYLGGGFPGAVLVTVGMFGPAFAFTLVGHRYVERVVENERLHTFLDGVTAGVVGLIVATGVELAPTTVPDVWAGLLFGGSLLTLTLWRNKAAIAVVVLVAGALGMLIKA